MKFRQVVYVITTLSLIIACSQKSDKTGRTFNVPIETIKKVPHPTTTQKTDNTPKVITEIKKETSSQTNSNRMTKVASVQPDTGIYKGWPKIEEIIISDNRYSALLDTQFASYRNWFERAKAIENVNIVKYPDMVQRHGDTLTLSVSSGESIDYIKWYAFREYIPEIDYYLIYMQYIEGMDYYLVSRKTGKTAKICQLPTFSTDYKHLIILSQGSIRDGMDCSTIQIWSITPDSLDLKFEASPGNFGPLNANWADDSTAFLIFSHQFDYTERKYVKQRVVKISREDEKWIIIDPLAHKARYWYASRRVDGDFINLHASP